MSQRTNTIFALGPAAAATAAALLLAPDARAEQKAWYIGVNQSFTHNTNVFRRNDTVEADNISSTGVLGGLHFEPGRQRIHLDASAQNNRFSKLSQLDNTSYSLSSGLDWQTVEHLSGSVQYNASQNLGDYSVPGTPEVKNVQSLKQFSASARYGFTGVLGLEGGVQHRTIDYSFTTERNTRENVANLGLRWGGGGPFSLGVAGRVTHGDSPNYRAVIEVDTIFGPAFGLGPVQPDRLTRRDIDFTGTWTPSAITAVDARVSFTRESHTSSALSSFNGLTGAVTASYQPTGKLSFKGMLVRDTGTETSFISLAPVGSRTPLTARDTRVDNNRINTVATLIGNWAATSKIGMNAQASTGRGTVSSSDFTQTTSAYSLGATYVPIPSVTLGCNVSRQTATGTASSSIVGCNASFILR
jgi:hypothetical protein